MKLGSLAACGGLVLLQHTCEKYLAARRCYYYHQSGFLSLYTKSLHMSNHSLVLTSQAELGLRAVDREWALCMRHQISLPLTI